MKIGFDAKRLFCNFTGLGNYSRTLLTNLNAFYPDNDYYLYTPKIKDHPDIDPFTRSNEYAVRLPDTRFKSYWRTFSIKKDLKNDRLDIFHGLSNEIPANIHKSNIISIVTIHDLIFKRYPETYQPFDRKMYDWKFRYACRHADRIVAISECTKRDIVHFYDIDPDKIEVIYQSCLPTYDRLIAPEDQASVTNQYQLPPEYLLSVGRIEERKNIKRIIEAYRHLSKDLRIPLVIIGKGGKYKIEAQELVHRSGLADTVIWMDGITDNDHLHAIYQQSKAFIYPSYYEGFGLPVVEALLSKTPVITSNRSSLPEAGGPFSLYVDPDSSEQIADAIEHLLTDPDHCRSIVDKGYQYAIQSFDKMKVTQDIMGCYQRAKH